MPKRLGLGTPQASPSMAEGPSRKKRGTKKNLSNANIYVEDNGGEGEVIIFSHGLLMTHEMFDHQIARLSTLGYRCIAYDHRGQAFSDRVDPEVSEISVEETYEDALELLDHLKLDKVHWVGLSMGGFVGMRLAARQPHRIISLSLLATSNDSEPFLNQIKYRILLYVKWALGMENVKPFVEKTLFGESFLNSAKDAKRHWEVRILANADAVDPAVVGIINRLPFDECHNIPNKMPVQCLMGYEDTAIPPERMMGLHHAIPHSTLRTVHHAGHSMSVENPMVVTQYLEEFIRSSSSPPRSGIII